MKKYFNKCKKFSFIIAAASLILYVLFEAADSIVGAFRGYNLLDMGVVFNIALIAAGVLMLFRHVKYAAIPFGVAGLVNAVWFVSYTIGLIGSLLNYGFRFFNYYVLGIFSVIVEYANTILGFLAMVTLGALCILVVLGKLPKLTKYWYIPAAIQLVCFAIDLVQRVISTVILLFGNGGLWTKIGYVYDFGAGTVISLLLLAGVAFSCLAVHTYTLIQKKQ